MKLSAALFGTTAITLLLSGSVLAQDCYQSSILSPTPFMGNDGEIFKLADGSVWEVKYEYEYMYEYNPSVIVCPSRGKLVVNQKSLNIVSISSSRAPGKRSAQPTAAPSKRSAQPTAAPGKWETYEETNLQGSISGTVTQGSIFRTVSGNVYEVQLIGSA